MNNQLLGAAVVLALLTGCTALPRPPVDEPGRLLRGEVSPEGSGWALRRCFSRETLELRDPTGLLSQRYAAQTALPGLPLFVELEASEASEVRRLLLVGGDARACLAEMDGIELRAAGHDPDWEADLSGNLLEVRDQRRLLRLRFRVEEASDWRGNGFHWQGALKAPGIGEHRVELSLEDGGCEDRAGIWYGVRARMKLDGERYDGCARFGDLAKHSLPGHYRSELVTEQGPVRTVELTLDDDGTAALSEDYHGHRMARLRTGTWKRLSSGRLMLHLLQRDGHDEQYLRLFSRRLDGTLVLEGEGPEFAPLGLRLSPAPSVPGAPAESGVADDAVPAN